MNISRWRYKATGAYKPVSNPEEWECCPNCGLKPLRWCYNNDDSTACGCGESQYDHFSIHAESAMSYAKRHNWSMRGYKDAELRNNWNHWVKTGEVLFPPELRNKDKW